MKDVDFRIHWALCACKSALKIGPELSRTTRLLIIAAMKLLLFANRFIKIKMEE